MRTFATSRDLAYSGLFGAAALLLPVLFHVLHLGRVFMPMYLPLVALGYFARPGPAAMTALVVPLLSAVITGMPPLYPPIAFLMAVELAVMAALIAATIQLYPAVNEWVVLVPVLALGRVLYVGMVYAMARIIDLPAGFVAGASFLAGWPGLILMLVVIPPLARLSRRRRGTLETKKSEERT
jgi:hypothetical protein